MSVSEEVRRLESELEINKEHLGEDVSLIRHKIDQSKAELSPTNLIRNNAYLALGVALSAGFVVGYFLDWRLSPKQVAIPMLEHIAKPAVRTIAVTAGKQLVTNAIRDQYHGHT
jgi:hypothetical protein